MKKMGKRANEAVAVARAALLRLGPGGIAGESPLRVLALISDRPNPAVTATRVRSSFMWPAVSRQGVELRILGTDFDRLATVPWQFPGIDAEFFQFNCASFPVRAWNLLAHSYHEWPHCHALAQRVR